ALSLPANLYKNMYPHQRQGVEWLWGLHQGDMGGILGDDMGLGKTYSPLQVACFLAGLFLTHQAKSVLVVAPLSVIRGWEEELGRWIVFKACPSVEVSVITSSTRNETRRRMVQNALRGGKTRLGCVCVTSYGLVSSQPHVFGP
ncbi:unnamed protein product, partial [Choristocarpus tenellus]